MKSFTLALGAICIAPMVSTLLRAQEPENAAPMQCCAKCCMMAKRGDADKVAKEQATALNKLIDEFKDAPQDKKLDVLSALLSKMVEQRKATEEKVSEPSNHQH